MRKFFLFAALFSFVGLSADAQFNYTWGWKRVRSSKPDARTCRDTLTEPGVFFTSRLLGTVIDSGDQVLPNTILELRSTTGNVLAKVKTDRMGHFEFPHMRPGNYLLKARWLKKGFDCIESRIELSGAEERPKTVVLWQSPVEVIIAH
jgi:hypothetical protein